jgi:hypothetical protein
MLRFCYCDLILEDSVIVVRFESILKNSIVLIPSKLIFKDSVLQSSFGRFCSFPLLEDSVC